MTVKPLALATALAVAAAASAAPIGAPKSNQFWWPERVDLAPLRQHSVESDPFGGAFDYAEAFAALDLAEVKADISAVLTGPSPGGLRTTATTVLLHCMAWHSAGTYRIADGRGGAGGQQRFEP